MPQSRRRRAFHRDRDRLFEALGDAVGREAHGEVPFQDALPVVFTRQSNGDAIQVLDGAQRTAGPSCTSVAGQRPTASRSAEPDCVNEAAADRTEDATSDAFAAHILVR